jgi:hypothetical protein
MFDITKEMRVISFLLLAIPPGRAGMGKGLEKTGRRLPLPPGGRAAAEG